MLLRKNFFFMDYTATQVTIGLQKTAYTVMEADTIVLVCTAVNSGSIARKTITIDYQTLNGRAEGIIVLVNILNTCAHGRTATFIYYNIVTYCLQLLVTIYPSVEALT